MRFFNTTGPVRGDKHYCVPPLSRLDLDDVLGLVRDEQYFVLHAPRQTGKTSALLALRDLLNSGTVGTYRCVYANVEGAQAAREDKEEALRAILDELASRALATLGDGVLDERWPAILAKSGPNGALRAALTGWAEADPNPLILLLDEIDTLVGDTLLSVLRQLRAGYDRRPDGFPQSVVLCGLRDVADYRIDSPSGKPALTGGSPFNIKAKSLRLGDFSRDETLALLAQHTEETGQTFTPDALDTVWTQTRGQPWLVNALAAETCFSMEARKDRARRVASADVLEARERLIQRRATHLDYLTDRLEEDRVRRVVEPILSGTAESDHTGRDVEYVRDLGLIARDPPLRMANPIYAEVVPRELTWATQEGLVQEAAWYVDPDGGLNVVALLEAFQRFFREHSEHWVERFHYREAGPQLLLQAYLQRVVNSGGRIEREYGLGRGRTDLLIIWPHGDRVSRFVIECKVLHPRRSLESTIDEGVEQTAGYVDRCAAEAGHLVIFDRNEGRSWDDKVFHYRRPSAGGPDIHVWGM